MIRQLISAEDRQQQQSSKIGSTAEFFLHIFSHIPIASGSLIAALLKIWQGWKFPRKKSSRASVEEETHLQRACHILNSRTKLSSPPKVVNASTSEDNLLAAQKPILDC